MKALRYGEYVLATNRNHLYALARISFDETDRFLCHWNGVNWEIMGEYNAPAPDALALDQHGKLFVALGWFGIKVLGSDKSWLEYPSTLADHKAFNQIAIGLDGRVVLAAASYVANDGTTSLRPVASELLLFEAPDLRIIEKWCNGPRLYRVALSPNGAILVAGADANLRMIWKGRTTDVDTGVDPSVAWYSLITLADGTILLGGSDGRLLVGSISSDGDYRFEQITGGFGAITCLTSAPHGSAYAVAGSRLLKISGRNVTNITPPDLEVSSVSGSRDGLVIGTVEEGIWFGPHWRRLPPILA